MFQAEEKRRRETQVARHHVGKMHERIRLCDIGGGMVQDMMAAKVKICLQRQDRGRASLWRVLRVCNGGGNKTVEESGSDGKCGSKRPLYQLKGLTYSIVDTRS